MKNLTAKQRNAFYAVRNYINAEGYSPTVRDIAAILGISVRASKDHLDALRRKGYLTWRERTPRTMRIVKNPPPDPVLPLPEIKYRPEDESRILINRIECKNCGDIIESLHRHDYVTCKCGKVAVDGGKAYFKRTGDDWIEHSRTTEGPVDQLRWYDTEKNDV